MVFWEGQVIPCLKGKENAFLASPGEVRKAVQRLWFGRRRQGPMTDHVPPKAWALLGCIGASVL